MTDRETINEAFAKLREQGIEARGPWTCCMSCGHAELEGCEPLGWNCCTLPLTQGYKAIVDVADYKRLRKKKWYARDASSKTDVEPRIYAGRRLNNEPGTQIQLMHREILDLRLGDRRKADHRNGNTLDNRRANLRVATSTQNQQNGRTRADNISGTPGVSWAKREARWVARITVDGRAIGLGYFAQKEEAVAARLRAEKEYFGEFAPSQR